MGEENVKLSDGILYIDGKELGSTFECDCEKVMYEHRDELFKIESIDEATLTCKMIFNTKLFYKLTGMWDWICDNCPNRKVVHLMRFSKSKRIREKNFKRALRIVGRMLDE